VVRDAENSYLGSGPGGEAGLEALLGHSISTTASRWGRTRGARRSRCRPWHQRWRPQPGMSASRSTPVFHAAHPCAAPLRGSLRLCKSAVLPICHCTLAWPLQLTSARRWSGCAATLRARRWPRPDWH
jgi:hypothetical protein